MSHFIANDIGLLGVALLLIAYFLLQSGRLTSLNLTYSWLNLAGSLMLLYSLFFEWNLPAVIIETVWAGLSLMGIWRAIRVKNQLKKRQPPQP